MIASRSAFAAAGHVVGAVDRATGDRDCGAPDALDGGDGVGRDATGDRERHTGRLAVVQGVSNVKPSSACSSRPACISTKVGAERDDLLSRGRPFSTTPDQVDDGRPCRALAALTAPAMVLSPRRRARCDEVGAGVERDARLELTGVHRS